MFTIKEMTRMREVIDFSDIIDDDVMAIRNKLSDLIRVKHAWNRGEDINGNMMAYK